MPSITTHQAPRRMSTATATTLQRNRVHGIQYLDLAWQTVITGHSLSTLTSCRDRQIDRPMVCTSLMHAATTSQFESFSPPVVVAATPAWQRTRGYSPAANISICARRARLWAGGAVVLLFRSRLSNAAADVTHAGCRATGCIDNALASQRRVIPNNPRGSNN